MTAPALRLNELQHWMLNAITLPNAATPDELNQRILPSRQQSAAERLGVYARAYHARLIEVLHELFPCTRFAVGDELFDQFAVDYLQQHPPHSYTLAHLADKLAEDLDATRPADWGAFVIELARLEEAIDRIFDAPGPEQMPPFVIPSDAAPSIRLLFVPGFELHAFRYPVSSFYTAWKAGRQPAWPEAAEQHVALFRRDYIVRRFELAAVQYGLLLTLQRGSPLGEALAGAADASGCTPVDELAAEFGRWFTVWAANGLFAAAI